MHIGKSAAQDAHDIAHGGAARRGDQADAVGEHGQRLFALGSKESFGFEAFLQLLEGELQRAEAYRLDILDVDLVFAACFIDADRAANGDVQAVLGAELDAALLLFEENAADLGAVVLEREVDMADWASRQLEISPSTQMSVKFLPRRSRIRAVSSLTVSARRVGWRLNVSWLILELSIVSQSLYG